MSTKPKVLLVNDDGVDAPGLWALYREIKSIAEPVVVAPMHEQSARSHAITVRRPMALSELHHGRQMVGYRLDGTPADCVKLALARMYRGQIALVVSGINWGGNLGHNILYSGTVAAALEAAMYGLPGLAVSLRDRVEPPAHYITAARVASRLARDILAHGLPPGVVLNVNVPNLPLHEIADTVLTRQGQEAYIDLFEITWSGNEPVWCANLGGERLPSPSSDHSFDDLALNKHQISITPIHFDLTCSAELETIGERIARLNLTGKKRQKEKVKRQK